MEFRPRNYIAEEETYSLTRSAAGHHPLSAAPPSSSASAPPPPENNLSSSEDVKFFDPLRGERRGGESVSIDEAPDRENASITGSSAAPSPPVPSKEWNSFKRLLMQKFPVSKMITVSSVSAVIFKGGKAFEKPDRTILVDELDDVENEGVKVITRQEYVSRLHDLKDEINRAWNSDDRVTALKLSIKVAKLLVDTSVVQFYPTLFVLATDVMDMLGELVWKRIRQKAEYTEDGTTIGLLPENFKANDVCFDAKETCNNWFCKVGAVRELLPRIYLELAIFPCWRFLLDRPEDNLQRLVMMIRGLADPLASAYCRLYMVHCAQKLHTSDKGHLIACINDLNILFLRPASAKETRHGYLTDKKRLLVPLIDPAIEYITKCIFDSASKVDIDNALVGLRLGRNQVDLVDRPPFVSIVLHHLLKELPAEILNSHAQDFLQLIQFSKDYTFDQCLNYRLLGFRLGEHRSQIEVLNVVLEEVMQAISQYDRLDEFLNVVDAYIDIVLQNQMDDYLSSILKALAISTSGKEVTEDDLEILQSIMIKLLSRLKGLDEIFALSHFLDILDVMYGRSRNAVNLHILDMATRKGPLGDPVAIQLLFEISQSLHDGMDLSHAKDDYDLQLARLISRFVQMVDYGTELERHLMFLVECRGAFSSINELKETLVHSSNSLATEALKDGKKQHTLVKSCIAFSEVTIPSIPTQVRQLNLYLETTEVALLAGLVSHSDGLVGSAVSCLESMGSTDGYRTPPDVDGMLSSVQKLCSLLVMVPGGPSHGITKVPDDILSLVCSESSWLTGRIRTRMLCATVLLLATLSQCKLPYRPYHPEIPSNDLVFFGDFSYLQDLASFSERALQNLVNLIEQEQSKAGRGSMALEACNCIASAFKASEHVSELCWNLIETATSCLSANDKYLQSTVRYLNQQQLLLPSSKPSALVGA